MTSLAASLALVVGGSVVGIATSPPAGASRPVAQARAAAAKETIPYRPGWGTIKARSGTLRNGCRYYTWSYHLTPPEGYWAMETVVRDPDGYAVASPAVLYGSDKLSGTRHFRLCRYATRPGRFVMTGKVSVQEGADEVAQYGMIKPSVFRLAKPKRKH